TQFSALALLCAAYYVCGADVKDKRQVGSISLQKDDHQVAESGGFGAPAAVHSGSKYFQYAHVPAKDHYEHGHKRGNEHHFIERHEKAHPHAGEFKTKVRWGDKHGGYGEHYWDYNHAGHGHDGGGEETQQKEEYVAYDESKDAPNYLAAANRGKRQPNVDGDVEFINDKARSLVLSGVTGKHGGNYRSQKDFERGKREFNKINGENLFYDPKMGLIVDQKSGIAYELKPVVDY
ncbi:unnamed protein product, partial [Tenebrio molitor]